MSRGPEISVVTNEVEHRRIRGCRVIFDKMQGRPTDLIPEKSLWVKELEELLPKAKSREKLAGLQGRAGEQQGCKGGRMQGSRDSARP
jgi:hypothetical protein